MASHTSAEENVQELLSDLNNDEAYCLTREDAKALNATEDFSVRKGQWIVVHIDDYSQSHWIVDNIVYIGNRRKAESVAREYARQSDW